MRFGSPSLKHVKSDLSTSNVSEITNFNVYYYFLVYVSIYFDIYQIHCYCIKPGKREVMCMYVRVIGFITGFIIFPLDFVTVPTVWYFLFFILT